MTTARATTRWDILKPVLQDIPKTIRSSKLAVAFYAIGVLLIGLSRAALDNFELFGYEYIWLLISSGPLMSFGLFFLAVSIYDWTNPPSLWRAFGWLIAIFAVALIIIIAFALVLYPLALGIGLISEPAGAFASSLILLTIVLLSQATLAYLAAYVITTSSFKLRLSRRVLKITLVMAAGIAIFSSVDIVVTELIVRAIPGAMVTISLVAASTSAILTTLILVGAVAAFKRYDPNPLGTEQSMPLPEKEAKTAEPDHV